jgi:hypothetical protein
MSFDIKRIIGTTAPWLATALGGPLAGQAVAAITTAMGLPAGSKVEDIQKALAAGQLTGDQMVAIKAAELQFQQAMAQAGFTSEKDLESIAEQDRDSARRREESVKDWTPRVLAYGITLGFFGVLVFMLTQTMPPTAHDALLLLLGALQTAWVSIVAYYFGSSAGSARKSELLSQAPAAVAAKAGH